MIKVSVIVPVYNVEKYLKRCLDSLVNQTLSDIEIICVNDGSTDGSAQILEEYAQKDNRIKVITQINSGVSEARNVGIKQATGEFIGYVDPDDFIEPVFYEKLYNSAVENNCDIACASVIRENNKKKKVLIKYDKQIIAKNVKEKFELAHIPEHCYIWNKIYRREKLISSGINFRREMVYEDMIYSPDVVEELDDMVVVPDVWYHYWNNDGSIVKNSSDKCRTDKITAQKHIIDICNKYHISTPKRDNLVSKREYYCLGIKVLKVYVYKSTKVYSLFGLIPILTMREYV